MNTTKVIGMKTVSLDSDMRVRFSGSTKDATRSYEPTRSSLKRVRRLMNGFYDADAPLVCIMGDGTFSVFRTFWLREPEPQS